MTKEELRAHCEKQVKMCEEWAKGNEREPSGKIYEEHKLILDLIKALEQQSIDKAMIHTLVEENEKLKADNKILAENCLKDLINCHSSIIKEQQPSNEDVQRVVDYLLKPVTPTHRMCKDCTKSKILNGFEGYSIVCSRFGRMAVNPDFYCADFEKGGSENGSN
jgi:hypothetical protein